VVKRNAAASVAEKRQRWGCVRQDSELLTDFRKREGHVPGDCGAPARQGAKRGGPGPYHGLARAPVQERGAAHVRWNEDRGKSINERIAIIDGEVAEEGMEDMGEFEFHRNFISPKYFVITTYFFYRKVKGQLL